jgi:hypothetical protein
MTEQRVAREWQVWAAANLLRGADASAVEARLLAEGVPADLAKALVDSLVASPLLEAASDLRTATSKLATVAAARSRQLNAAAHPCSIVREEAATPERFFAAGMPVLLTGLVPRAFDVARWAPRALAERFGDEQIEATVGRDGDEATYGKRFHRPATTMPLRDLVDRMERVEEAPRGEVYAVAANRALERTRLRELRDAIHFPDGWIDERALREDGGAALWLGPAGTKTTLHYDAKDVLFCQLHGRKRWRLVPPLDPALGARVTGPQTTLDPDSVEGALVKELIVGPGEALFVPAGWWHHVIALDASVSVSVMALRGLVRAPVGR